MAVTLKSQSRREITKEYRGDREAVQGDRKICPHILGAYGQTRSCKIWQAAFLPQPKARIQGGDYRNAGGVNRGALVGPVVDAGDGACIAPDVGDCAEHAD